MKNGAHIHFSKNVKTFLKFVCLLASLFVLALQLHAEVLIYPAGPENHVLTITNGQTITINSYQSVLDQDGSYPIAIAVSNVTYLFNGNNSIIGLTPQIFPDKPITLTGPCQLIFSNTAAHFFAYSSFTGTGLQTIFLPSSGASNSICVPANKSIVFLTPSPNDSALHTFSITSGSNTFDSAAFGYGNSQGVQLSGPLTITAYVESNFYDSGYVQIVSYYFTEDFAAVPQFGAIQTPTGKFSLVIEKSLDLSKWSTAFFTLQSSASQAFYRFNVKK